MKELALVFSFFAILVMWLNHQELPQPLPAPRRSKASRSPGAITK